MSTAVGLTQLTSPRWFSHPGVHSWRPEFPGDGCTFQTTYWMTDLVILFGWEDDGAADYTAKILPADPDDGRAVDGAGWGGPERTDEQPTEEEQAEGYADRARPCWMSKHKAPA